MSIIKKAIFITLCLYFFPKHAFAQVVINEFLPNPLAGNNEWVELYNLGNTAVGLSGWILSDDKEHDYPLDILGEIKANDFSVFIYSSGDGWLNNSGGDTVYLKNSSGDIVDSHVYSSAPDEGKSFGRSPDGSDNWIVLDEPTQGSGNPTPTSTPTVTPEPPAEPTATPEPPTSTPTSMPPTSTSTPKPTVAKEVVTSSDEGQVLALSDEGEVGSTGDEAQAIKDLYQPPEKKKSFLFPAVLIVGGIGLVSFSVYSFLKKEEGEESDESL